MVKLGQCGMNYIGQCGGVAVLRMIACVPQFERDIATIWTRYQRLGCCCRCSCMSGLNASG